METRRANVTDLARGVRATCAEEAGLASADFNADGANWIRGTVAAGEPDE
ncbi:MAG: hypothetical protein OEU54_00110 [Gemmatimonadota bacterium]|nr:hypothetical protein [Gemmatimonadota bacterium]